MQNSAHGTRYIMQLRLHTAFDPVCVPEHSVLAYILDAQHQTILYFSYPTTIAITIS